MTIKLKEAHSGLISRGAAALRPKERRDLRCAIYL
jgi:hypothetical protein